MLEVTQRLGGTNYVLWGGREGYDTLLNTDLRRGRPTRPVPSPRRRAQAPDRVRGHAAHRAEADGADEASVRLRLGDDPRLPRSLEDEYHLNIEANHATLAGHSFHHEVAYAVAHGILGSIDANRGDPQNGWDTDQFPNSVEDLACRSTRSSAAAGSGPAASTSTRSCAARAPTGPTCSWPTSAGSTRWPGRCWSPPSCSRTGRWRIVSRSARWSGPLGTAILDGHESLASLEAKVASGRSTRDRCPGTRSCSRTWSTRRSRTSPAPAAGRRPTCPRDRRVDDRDEGRPDRRGRGGRWRRGVGVRVRNAAARLGWQDPGLWWDGTVEAIGRVLVATGEGADISAVGLTGQMHGAVLLDERDEVLRPAILWNDQRTAHACDEIRGGRPGPAHRDHRQRRTHRVHRTEARLGPRPRAGRLDADRFVLLPKDYVRLRLTGEHAMDKADGSGTILFDLAARDIPRDPRGAPDRSGLAAADVRRPEVTGAVSPAAAAATGSGRGRRSWPAAATKRRTPSGRERSMPAW